jgi:hypothetical protein
MGSPPIFATPGTPVTPANGRTGDAVLGHRDGHLLGSPGKSR